MKVLILAAALCGLSATVGAQRAPPACETLDVEDISNLVSAEGKFVVLAVGDIITEKGNNLCGVSIDTDLGRIRLKFTTVIGVDGSPLIKRVSAKFVSME